MQRVAIVGTAPSWKQTPWNDPGLRILGLNDAYQLGWPRADEWYDIHPLNKFFYPPRDGKAIYSHEVPPGHYVRPANHLDWLSKLQIPLWLTRPEDHMPAESYTLPPWPCVQVFPKQAIEAYFGRYFSSTPAWMLAHAIMRGAREVHIYGIHLSTEHEYIEQRPNFEFLLGRVLGPGRWRETVTNGLRRYETDHGVVVLPVDSPVLQSAHQYGFQARPRTFLEPLKWEMHKVQVKRERAIQTLKKRPWWAPYVTVEEPNDDPRQPPTRRVMSTSALQEELWRLDALAQDYSQQMQRVQMEAQVM